MLAAALLNPLCLALSPLALAWVLGYSLSKRFTWWPHLWLGLGLAIAPVGGYLAVSGPVERAGLDAARHHRRGRHLGRRVRHLLRPARRGLRPVQGLRSAVVRLGERRAILLAKLLHGVTVPALALFGWGAGFGLWYYLGVLAAAGDPGVRAPARPSRRPVAARRRLLYHERRDSLTVFAFALVDRLGVSSP